MTRTGPAQEAHRWSAQVLGCVVPGRLAVLRRPAFRWFFLGQLTSSFGDFLAAPVIAFAILDLSGSASDVGLVLLARSLPIALFMLLGGVVADRLPRHRVMIGSDLVRSITQGCIAALLLGGSAHVGEIAALQVVHGIATAMFTPALTGLVRQSVPEEELQPANALRSFANSVTMILGPLAASAIVVLDRPGWALAVDATTYAASALCLSRLGLGSALSRSPLPVRDVLGDLREGWLAFSRHTWVWSLICSASLANALYAVLSVLGPLLSRRELGPQVWGLMLSAFGAGATCGGLVALYVHPRRPLQFAVGAMTCMAVPSLGMSVLSSPMLLAVGGFIGGVGLMIFNPIWETVLQQRLPVTELSKVSAYEWLGSYTIQPLGFLVAGPLSGHLGVRHALLLCGLLQIAISLSPLAGRELREIAAVHR